ncbi:MAG: archaeal proteasome endopeptidase complex subunit beta [Candidatus Hodarchaeaceae archaeon]|nr:archaeal proteasome endopeptidase complex subunit beta [Candidatus Hodarchaeaceae archaeon]
MKNDQLKYLEGTTTIGLICKDGVILVTDTRATMGNLVASKQARKIYKITDTIGITVAGGVADTQALVNILRAEAGYYHMREGVPMNVRAAARLVANVLHAYRLFPYIANLLVGGVDAKGQRLHFIDLDGSLTEETMVATGSGSPVAYGLLESEFKEGITTKEALPIAVKAIKAAMKRDIATGNELMVAVITNAGYKELSPEEIKKLA